MGQPNYVHSTNQPNTLGTETQPPGPTLRIDVFIYCMREEGQAHSNPQAWPPHTHRAQRSEQCAGFATGHQLKPQRHISFNHGRVHVNAPFPKAQNNNQGPLFDPGPLCILCGATLFFS